MASSGKPTPTTATEYPTLTIYVGADSFSCGLKDALVAHLRTLPNLSVVDLGTDAYYTIADRIGRLVSTSTSRGLLACGTGVGVSIFANKHPRVFAAHCFSVIDALNARSINSCNVLTLSGMSTAPQDAIPILHAWLTTPFKSPCPASDNAPWPDDITSFLDNSVTEKSQLPYSNCAIYCLRKGMEFEPIGIMPGAEIWIVRESPTSAVVRFKAGSVEPTHRHSFGHDVVVMKGRKKVWNLDKGESWELNEGDFLFTPTGDVHRVKYFEDTELFIRWDGIVIYSWTRILRLRGLLLIRSSGGATDASAYL